MASTPICRCRVLYLGSAVPHITKDGLHGIQEPLRELYPEEGVQGAKGIDSWLSVWSNGLLLENVDEKHKRVTRFFPIDSLHYCAAVRHVRIPGGDGDAVERFLPLDSPFARVPSAHNPPLFACILRRVAGIKVLECHAFVCKKEMAANALVRCCFHAYADHTFARRLETGSVCGDAGPKATPPVSPIQKVEQWRAYVPGEADGELASIYGDENHKVWTGEDQQSLYADYASTIRSAKSSRPRQLESPSSPPPPPPVTTVAVIEATPVGQKREARPKGRGVANGHAPRRYAPMSASEFRPGWPPRMRPGYMPVLMPPMGPRLPPGLIPVPPPQVPHASKGRSAEEPVYMPSGRALSPVASYKPGAFPYEQYYLNQQGSPHPAPYGSGVHPGPYGNGVHAAPYGNGAHVAPHHGAHPSPYGNGVLVAPQHGNGAHPSPYGNGVHLAPHHGNGVHTAPHHGNGVHAAPHHGNGVHVAPHHGNGVLVAPHHGNGVHAASPNGSSMNGNGNSNGTNGNGGASPTPAPTGKPSKYKKKKDKDTSDSDSKFNTGIYRKKGHLNERAFSYSIRQEHRSRSHSSLATLSFAEPNGVANGNDHGALNGHGANGKAPAPARTNGKVNGNGKANGTGKAAKKGGKVVKTMNDLSLSDGEIQEIGNGPRRKGTAGNHR